MVAKEAFGLVAGVLTFVAFAPYILSTLRGTTVPHLFSWIIWGSTTLIVFFAQLAANGGIGAWPIGLSGTISLAIALLAFVKRGDGSITRTDWIFFVTAMSALPLWFVTSDPLTAVILLTTIDIIGFGPTLRKTRVEPYSESLLFYGIFVIRNVFATIALEHYSATTVLFPVALGVACLVSMGLIAWWRRKISSGFAVKNVPVTGF